MEVLSRSNKTVKYNFLIALLQRNHANPQKNENMK